MRLRVFLTALLLLTTVFANAQEYGCGTPEPTAEQIARFRKMPRNYMNAALMKLEYPLIKVPVSFHIVTVNNGSAGVSPDALAAELKLINKIYATVGIEFFCCSPPDYIMDDDLYNFNGTEINSPKIQKVLDTNTIDVFFFGSLQMGSASLCGYTYYPGGPDYVMMANSCLNGVTLAHELGHYFSLYHTHDSVNLLTAELVDGSNCDSTGDEICDTPADPNIYGLVNENCQYTGDDRDANGALYKPMVNNIMSYSLAKCRDRFTDMQLARIREGFEFERAYLCCSAPVAHFEIKQDKNSISFHDSSDYAMSVDWDFGDGIKMNGFSGSHTYDSAGIYTISIVASNGCGSTTSKVTVKLQAPSKPLPLNAQVKIYPNPSDDKVYIKLANPVPDMDISIFGPDGRYINSLSFKEHSSDEFPIAGEYFPAAGLYFIRVDLPGGSVWLKALIL